MKRPILLLLALSSLFACTSTDPSTGSSADIDALFNDYEAYTWYTYPEYATYNGIHDYNDRLNDQSPEAGEAYIDSIKVFREKLLGIDRNGLSETQQLNYDLFLFSLNQTLNTDAYEISHYSYFNQQNGYHITFPQIIEYQPLKTEKDIDNYFARLRLFPEQVSHVINLLEEGKSKGITLSCAVSEQVLNQLAGFAAMDATASPLYMAKDKSETLAAHAEELKDLVENTIGPAYESLHIYYRDNYHSACRTAPGISNIDGGAEYYEHLVRQYTSSNLKPGEVFDLGMKEVARIREEMIITKDELGYGDMELIAFFNHLRTSPEYYFDKKEDLLSGYRDILDNMDEQLPDMFGKLPKAPYDLKEMEEYRAKAAPTAYYYPVPEDGSRPGYFYVNTYDLNSRPKYTMTALALHEAVPGHHLQIALATELKDVPWFRKQMQVTAFVEGWGLYAEYLGYESGMYDDPLQKMGALSFEMWRACRLVVDVGVHYKGWSRDEAVDFLRNNAPLAELDINSEIDRYISWPGQALAYKIGELKLKELRARAEKALGNEFDLKAFHDAVLANGSIPLELLEKKIGEWVDRQLNA